MRRLTISVVVPTWRREGSLLRCLEALRSQTRAPDEVVVVVRNDDARTEQGLATARLLPDGLSVVRIDGGGQVSALNAGIDSARGEVVALTDDDTAPRARWLELIETHFLNDDAVGGVGGRDWVHSIEGLDTAASRQPVGKVQWFGRVLGNHHRGVGPPREVEILKGANMSYRSAAISHARFDDRLLGSGAQVFNDAAFSLLVRRAGWKLVYDPEVGVDHFPANREDDPRGGSIPLGSIVDAGHNETLAVMEYLPGLRRPPYLIWAFLVGTRAQPGVLQAIRSMTGGRRRALAELRASLTGRMMGVRRWRRTKRRPVRLRS